MTRCGFAVRYNYNGGVRATIDMGTAAAIIVEATVTTDNTAALGNAQRTAEALGPVKQLVILL